MTPFRPHAPSGAMLLAVTATLFVSAAPLMAQDECPSGNCCGLITNEARCEYPCEGVKGSGYAAYDLVHGTFSASGGGGDVGHLSARDRYTCIGLPTGTTLTISVELHVTGFIRGLCGYFSPSQVPSGDVEATLEQSGSQATLYASNDPACDYSTEPPWFCCPQDASADSTLRLSIGCTAGQPFELRMGLLAGAGRMAGAQVSATLRFADLPPGATITSCHGYRQDAPTPVHRSSWGSLKQIYR